MGGHHLYQLYLLDGDANPESSYCLFLQVQYECRLADLNHAGVATVRADYSCHHSMVLKEVWQA